MMVLIRPVSPTRSPARPLDIDTQSIRSETASLVNCFGVATNQADSCFWVPASVRSKPGTLLEIPGLMRSAISPWPGHSNAEVSLSDQRNQPTRDRFSAQHHRVRPQS